MPKQNLQLNNPAFRYGFALAMVAITILLRYALTPVLGMAYQYVTIFPAIVVVAIFAGMGPAVVMAFLGSLIAEYYFSPALEISNIPVISIAVFTAFLAGWLSQRLHDALAQSRRQTDARAKSEQRLRAIFDNAGIGILEVEGSDRFVAANDKACSILGRSREQLLNMDVHELTWPDDRELSDRLNRELHEGLRKGLDYEKRYIRGDGSPVWVHLTISRILDSKGRWTRSITTIEDITERKLYLEQLEQIKNQLENRSKELETIISIVSHDLRAPLVNVRGFAKEIDKDIKLLHDMIQKETAGNEILKKIEPLSDDFVEATHFINSSAEAMDNLAVSLVNVARAGLQAVNPEQIDMNELIAKVVESIQFKFTQNNIKYDIMDDLLPCFGDKTQITQIFTNLLDNAAKYLDPERPGLICVGCDIERGHAVYWISDNGIGIEPENQEKIFDPYYQLHEKAAGGIGMGLTTVKRMVDRNNGKIWVFSEKQKGTTFYIALPMHP
jgi:PAS domain S-box-containing protein